MRGRLLMLMAILSAAIIVAPVALHAQTSGASQRTGSPPLTAWGDPDLRGIWDYATMTPLERAPELGEKASFTEEEAAAYERQFLERQAKRAEIVGGPDWWDEVHLANRRTSLIVDPPNGRIPPLTPEAQKRAAALAQARERGAADSLEALGLNVRCIQWASTGPPMVPFIFNNNVQIFQTREYVTIYNEMIHSARIVPLDGRPHGTIRQWVGDSRGRWEGRTLVVDTVNFSDKASFRGSGRNLHLVERFTRTGPDTVEYQFTVEDPTVWTQPWTAVIPMRATAGPIFEFACHEGNALSMEGILGAARAEEKRPNR